MINYLRLFNIFGSCIISAFLGIGSQDVINQINHTTTYGFYASYIITALLVILFNIHYFNFSREKEK